MTNTLSKRSKKAGLPPGALVHVGERKSERTRITLLHYRGEDFESREISEIDACRLYKHRPGVTWIHVSGLHQVEQIEKLNECFGLHALILEDILNTDQRPKMEDLGDYIFVVLKMIYPGTGLEIVTEQVSLILGANILISFQESENGFFDPVRERIRTGKGRLRKSGPDYLAHALLDAIVDHYFVILENLGEDMEGLEQALIARPNPGTLTDINRLKREMIFLRKSVWPLREVINGLERVESPLIRESTGIYLRDVYDHTIQIIDNIETIRDMLSGMIDIYLSSISNRMNEIMKVLTIIATLFIPLTFIVGLYGMNFKYMPELEWPWGYPAILGVMAVVAGCMLLYFRRKKWL